MLKGVNSLTGLLTPFFYCPAVEKWSSRQAHNLKIGGSNPSRGIMNLRKEYFDPPDGMHVKIDPWTDPRNPYETLREHTYTDPWRGFTSAVPARFRSDGGSFPKWARRWLDNGGPESRGFFYHDAEYRLQLVGSQKYADDLLLAIHELDEVPKWKRVIVYLILRWKGSKAWDENTKKLEANRVALGVTPADLNQIEGEDYA